MTFDLYVGIDYSGAETPESRLKGLQMYAAKPGAEPTAVRPPSPLRNWSRRDLAIGCSTRSKVAPPCSLASTTGSRFRQRIFADTA